MNNIRRVDVQAASEQLVHEILAVIVSEVLSWIYDPMHIGLHEVSNDVDVLIAGLRGWLLHVDEADNIFVVEELYSILKIE